jgi:hypothetical protein
VYLPIVTDSEWSLTLPDTHSLNTKQAASKQAARRLHEQQEEKGSKNVSHKKLINGSLFSVGPFLCLLLDCAKLDACRLLSRCCSQH